MVYPYFRIVVALLVLLAGAPSEVMAAEPLLVPGKQSLYQRVVARPGSVLYDEPSTTGAARAVVPFTALYVYERQELGGAPWVRVGTDSHGQNLGWLAEDQVIEWQQSLTVAFREPLGRDRVMLFSDRESLKALVDSRDLETYRALYDEAVAGEIGPDSPVAAIQPSANLDIQENFYLVPILDHEDVFLGDRQARMLKVASVPLEESKTLEEKEAAAPARDYRSGVVFVIDSTVSMGPYIDRTREVVRGVYDAIEVAELENQVSFGLIAYRDNVAVRPELGYLTREFADLRSGLAADTFFERVAEMEPAEVSSKDFKEDAYAGIKRAIEDMDWRDFDARFIILVTDAGPRSGGDPLSATGLDTRALRQLAQDKGVAIWVMHLLTPQGARDHAAAEREYRVLSTYPGIGDFYYGVGMGDVDEFGDVLEALAIQLTEQVRKTLAGASPVPATTPVARQASELARLQQKVETLGYALRMRYLQKRQGVQAPTVFDAWLVDRDFENPDVQTVDVRVLLTRDQLSDMQDVLRRVLQAAEEGLLSPGGFINDLKSVAASLSRDPSAAPGSTRVAGAGGQNLADLGYMREYIEDLPYTGEVMNVSLDDWAEWPAREQIEFIHRIEAKINYYTALHDNTDLWVSLDGGAVTGDSVFPVALELLP
ncbi:MAG: vWA domain-containing protein [Gammaproteobacteria bacterium]|nr:vWA domain-containing protein [Gammaproteobacteria bacterium]